MPSNFNPFRRAWHAQATSYQPPPGPPPQTVYSPPNGPPPSFYAAPPGPPPPSAQPQDLPPDWSATTGKSHTDGLYSDAPEDEYELAIEFCNKTSLDIAKPLDSSAIETILRDKCQAWTLCQPARLNNRQYPAFDTPRWRGNASPIAIKSHENTSQTVSVSTTGTCKSVCLLSNLPILAPFYSHGVSAIHGVYFEITNITMTPGAIIAIGTACKPYPLFRMPGWNRLSVGLHLDDLRTFCDNPDGGIDLPDEWHRHNPKPLANGASFGCGIDVINRSVFFTHNGQRILPDAYRGVYSTAEVNAEDQYTAGDFGPRDVFAAIGIEVENERSQAKFDINFGAAPFRWLEGNSPQWRVNTHIGKITRPDNELPSY